MALGSMEGDEYGIELNQDAVIIASFYRKVNTFVVNNLYDAIMAIIVTAPLHRVFRCYREVFLIILFLWLKNGSGSKILLTTYKMWCLIKTSAPYDVEKREQ